MPKMNFATKKFLVEFVSHTQYIEDDWEGRNCQDLEMTITQELFLTAGVRSTLFKIDCRVKAMKLHGPNLDFVQKDQLNLGFLKELFLTVQKYTTR